jgi:hypothetical protein
MAKRVARVLGVSFTAQALGSVVAASSTFSLQPLTSATQIVDVDEILISGMASASTLGSFIGVQMSTLGATPTALANPNGDGPMQQGSTPVIQSAFITATTQGTPSSSGTAPGINLGVNTFGGIIRWNAAPTQQYTMIGNASPGGIMIINQSTVGATTTANAHIIYEPY